MDYLNVFTSTGMKLLHHHYALRWLKRGYGTPITLQIAPTSKCNLRCVFCSNANRRKHEHLEFAKIKELLRELRSCGLKSVEITGGGEPSLYEDIERLIDFCSSLKLKQGLITNGIATIKRVRNLHKLWWVRVSMNSLDYMEDIDVPSCRGVALGFSYVINKNSTPAIWKKLKKYVAKHKPEYARIVPNCQATDEEQTRHNESYGKMVAKMGAPFFYQAKVFRKPDNCYWCYFKPFLLHDGFVYPCSSVVLNDAAGRRFHEKYRWTDMEGLPFMYLMKMESFPTNNCNHCVFSQQNRMLSEIMNPSGMEDFI